MITKIKDIIKVNDDSFVDKIYEDYKKNKINITGLINILKDKYILSDETTAKLMKELCIGKEKTTQNEELISIIIPTYNRKKELEECINSILRQTYKNIEIIIVDDCSSDGTISFLKRKYQDTRIKIYKNKNNSGAGCSRKIRI